MPLIELSTVIAAPIERVFDLSRSIDLHLASTSNTTEQAIAGVNCGLIGPGQEVTWRARHLGMWQPLTVQITAFERPTHFADEMVRGAFRRMEHHHHFEPSSNGTTMRDVFRYESPVGFIGRVAEELFLKRYLRTFLSARNGVNKAVAESEAWRQYLRDA